MTFFLALILQDELVILLRAFSGETYGQMPFDVPFFGSISSSISSTSRFAKAPFLYSDVVRFLANLLFAPPARRFYVHNDTLYSAVVLSLFRASGEAILGTQ